MTSNTKALPGTPLAGAFYSVTAHYSGDGTFAPSDSASALATVSPEPSTTALSILSFNGAGNLVPFTSGPYGSPIYMRADVSGQSGVGTPMGTVQFLDISFFQNENLNSQGNAETATGVFTLVPGSHSPRANYLGDNSFMSSSGSAGTITITPGSTSTSMQASSTTIGFGSNVKLTATVATSSAGAAPTQNVTFNSGTTQLTTVAVSGTAGIGNLQTGQFVTAQSTATLSASALPLGQNTITAKYGGDTNYSASTSAAIIVNVVPDFSLPGSLSPITIAAGQSGTTTLTVTGKTSYNGTINFTAASCSGLPSLATCSFSPASVKGSGKTTITISTTAPHSAALQHFGLWASGGGLLVGAVFFGLPLQFPRKRFFALLAFACLGTAVGCGGGNGGGSSPQPIPGTPPGTYNATVSASSSGLTHTTSFTLTVH